MTGQPSFWPASIDSHFDEDFAAAGVAEQMQLASNEALDAGSSRVLATAVGLARELTKAPVG